MTPVRPLSSLPRAPCRMVCSISRELAAPQPVVVVEIGIAFAATTTGAMARRAIIGEGHASLRARKVQQLRIGDNVGDRRRGELVHHRTAHRFQLREVVDDGGPGVIAEHALRGIGQQRPGRINDPIADRPDDGDVKQPQPPARQRGIQFAQAIPFMSGGRGAGECVNFFMIFSHGSILPQRNARRFIELLLARRP